MLTLRRHDERGHSNIGWLNSHHSFSFGEYHDPQHMGIANLRVINDDTVAPGAGFATHGHSDMEIISYVLEGSLEHKDSMGNGSVIRPGDVQRMSAGTGVRHSEYNHSKNEDVHFLQIWLEPNQMGIDPGYEQKFFSPEERQGVLKLLVSPDGRDGSITAYQDAMMYGSILSPGESLMHPLETNKQAYIHIAKGEATINGAQLTSGDAVNIKDETEISIEAAANTELLLFELS
jgi:redox-sensitive bicupin YhaK (pirin superfamily)